MSSGLFAISATANSSTLMNRSAGFTVPGPIDWHMALTTCPPSKRHHRQQVQEIDQAGDQREPYEHLVRQTSAGAPRASAGTSSTRLSPGPASEANA